MKRFNYVKKRHEDVKKRNVTCRTVEDVLRERENMEDKIIRYPLEVLEEMERLCVL